MPYELLDEAPKGRYELLSEPEKPKGFFDTAKSLAKDYAQLQGNALAGAVRGAGSIGATLLSPIDIARYRSNLTVSGVLIWMQLWLV